MKHILILHTGGTIGMVPGPDGLTPSEGVLEQALDALAGPDIAFRVEAFDPLVDSAEMGAVQWNRLIERVSAFQGAGVIITHGTDTMSFTGAALAHALAGGRVPVVLCGSMTPLNMGGDAEANLALAVQAVQTAAPAVWLAFAGQVLPAVGLVKHHSQHADAFRSVPQAGLPASPRPRRFAPGRRVAILALTPGLPASAIAAALAELDGAVLRVFGAGTIMSDPALEAVLTQAVARGCRIRAVSQCEQGGLMPGAYAAGAALWRAGVENGGAETPEAALAKLWLDLSDAAFGDVPE